MPINVDDYPDAPHGFFRSGEAVVKSNTVDLAHIATKGLKIGDTAGNIKVDLIGENGTRSTGTYYVNAGEHFKGIVTRVYSTGTDSGVTAMAMF